jgi:peptidoglycan/LPS O-acetylase OafA/YrhL
MIRLSPVENSHQDANLDILRAIAVLSVFFTHLYRFDPQFYDPAFQEYHASLGRAGVLIFFVHTSLVLMQSLERTGKKLSGWPLTRYFYIRRVFRIYPLSICLIVLSIAFSIPSNPLAPYRSYRLGWLLTNLLLVQNITGTRNVSDPEWSLPYEVQMYVVLPVLFLVLRAGAGYLRAILIYAAGVIVSLIHWLLQFVPCFLSGVIAYELLKTVRPRFRAWLWIPTILVAVVVFTITPYTQSRWKWASICLFIGLSIPLFQQNGGVTAIAAATVAKYSYGIYLSHLPLIWLIYHKLTISDWQRPILAVVGTGVTSWICFHTIERPLIRAGTRLADWELAKPASFAAAAS